MRHRPLVFAAFTLLVCAGASARPLDYRIDPVHTQILFSVDHDGYSHPVGRMKVKAGWLRFDEDDWSTAKVVVDIDTASADMGDKDWNDAVTGKRFLDAKQYPLVHFESTAVERAPGLPWRPAGNCPSPSTAKIDAYSSQVGQRVQPGLISGNLTLHGVTLPVHFTFDVNRVGATIFGLQTIAGFSAHALLDRASFGISAFPKAVGLRVDVWLEVEAILDRDAQKEYATQSTQPDSSHAAAQH